MHAPTASNRSLPRLALALAVALLVPLAGCGGGGGGGGEVLGARVAIVGLEQAAYEPGTTRYVHGYGGAIPTLAITGAPADADGSRWAMLHDGSSYRLYFMRLGDDTTLYQFGYNASARAYEYGYDSISRLGIAGAPPGADPSSIAMLHDGSDYRLYMRDRSDPRRLHQFAYNASSGDYEYGYRSISGIDTTGAPADADFSRWAMLHDGTTYRQYVAKSGSADTLYQFGFDGRTYAFGYSSIAQLTVEGMPSSSNTSTFAMQHGGGKYRFYNLSR